MTGIFYKINQLYVDFFIKMCYMNTLHFIIKIFVGLQ